jgi:hypothetical protein
VSGYARGIVARLKRLLPMRLKIALRRLRARRARARGIALATPQLPQPGLPPSRRPMRLTRALLACDLNPRYLESWGLVARAWEEIAGVEPVLVLVANERDAPAELVADERVRLFPPVEGLHTAFQAQCVRLLYPALLEGDGAVLISDVDLLPLDPDYFHGPLRLLDERQFVALRDAGLGRSMLAMAYNAARPEVWREIFGASSLDDVRARLAEWSGGLAYDGVRGGDGWYTDQRVLHASAMTWGERTGRLWILEDAYTGFRRLDRDAVESGIGARVRRGLEARRYSDYHSLVPYGEFRATNEQVLELALRPRQRRRRTAGEATVTVA